MTGEWFTSRVGQSTQRQYGHRSRAYIDVAELGWRVANALQLPESITRQARYTWAASAYEEVRA